jgi:hypothetical protein
MALTFLSGTAPDYLGFIFTTQVGLIDKIQEVLTTAGWVTYYKSPDGLSLTMVGTTLSGGHTCNMEFTIKNYTSITNGKYLVIRGWHESTKVTGSPDNYHRLIFTDGSVNRLWLTADEDAGCVCIYGASGSMGGLHFGFLDRLYTDDQWAWMVGNILSSGYDSAYVAKNKYNNTSWYRLGLDYATGGSYNATTFDQSYFTYPSTCLDLTMQGQAHNRHATEASNTIPFYNPYNGRLNYDGRALIGRYCYIEGRGGISNYPEGSYSPLYFRGFVKHAYTGLSSLPSGAQLTDVYTGYRMLSVGPGWWQGMRIQ